MATMKGKRVLTSLYLDPDVATELKKLSTETRVPQAVYLREAVELLLAHYRHTENLILGEQVPRPPTLERFIRASQLPPKTPKPRSSAKHK
jgi:predicted DNA-binding protein